ncbi:hypothetical protein DMA11_11040 [Marinilabiliaceae bacterium JC017]|nr:hypothetical protein DMA11_11040 [Marinilabiliaceae bacterium JC017]
MDDVSILYQDEYLIAIDKPIDLPIHKNEFIPRGAMYATKLLGKLTGKPIFPVHRLDAKTTGVIVFAFSREMAGKLTRQFERKEVRKSYVALVRGLPDEEGCLTDEVVIKKKKKRVSAITRFKRIKSVDTTIAYKTFTDVPISMVQVFPETGRWHQIRQHFAMQRNDIIGDIQHGDWTLNRIVTDITGITRLFLHAVSLEITHPVTEQSLFFEAPLPDTFTTVLEAVKSK